MPRHISFTSSVSSGVWASLSPLGVARDATSGPNASDIRHMGGRVSGDGRTCRFVLVRISDQPLAKCLLWVKNWVKAQYELS
jgi:hypothetical protein